MTVSFEPEAQDTLNDISDFVDSLNTDGAGQFWVTNFILNIYSYAKPNVIYAVCSHAEFAKDGLSCISYNGWVIAFRIEDSEFVVYYIVRGSILA